jgi:hypothetical protein
MRVRPTGQSLDAEDAERQERAIASLSDSEGAPLAEVRALFARELLRLELNAKVRRYLPVLAACNVRATLRRRPTAPLLSPPMSQADSAGGA